MTVKQRHRPLAVIAALFLASLSFAQTPGSYERSFPQSKAMIEKTLQTMQSSLSGRLPILDGFAKAGDHPLDRYERGYFQSSVTVTPSAGGSVVKVTTKVTAWYADPAHSGYQLLTSNGRIETDLLDQLQEQLAKLPSEGRVALAASPTSKPASTSAAKTPAKASEPNSEPAISAPQPSFPDTNQTFSSSLKQGLSSGESEPAQTPEQVAAEKNERSLRAELTNLQEIRNNTGHPKNLVAVKKSGTPVVAKPSLNAKPEFLAAMHDEFELLDFNPDWVHVRISGLSRGWIWRNSVEMPDGIPDTDVRSAPASTAADLFRVSREEAAPFPGDWAPLRGKNVKIISVQKADENGKDASASDRLEYAKFLLQQKYAELAKDPEQLQGLVVIFDAADGGMIAATATTIQQWRAGTLTDAALWHQCFFDPPETFEVAAPSGSK